MEKVEKIKRSNDLVGMLCSRKAKYIIGTILLSGIGIVLPRIVHVLAGSTAGAILLPMHIAVVIAALTFGITSASIVAGSSVIFSYLLTGMPSIERLPYMLIELVIYAILLGALNKKFNSYISFLMTIILGRVLYAGILAIAVQVLGFSSYGISVLQSVQIGLPGIILQLLGVPFLAKRMKERLNLKND